MGNSPFEHKVGNRFVDGYCAEKNAVFEFHGCFYHGCPKCTNTETFHPYRNIPNDQVHADTQAKEQYLRDQGCEVIVEWECNFRRNCKNDPDLKAFVDTFTRFEPLQPRDAFYGGRTNAIKLHHKCQGDEQIRYLDVTSEYPFVNKYKQYPIGHHVQITKNFLPSISILVLFSAKFCHLRLSTYPFYHVDSLRNWRSHCAVLVPRLSSPLRVFTPIKNVCWPVLGVLQKSCMR